MPRIESDVKLDFKVSSFREKKWKKKSSPSDMQISDFHSYWVPYSKGLL